jgi:hypothetical protein
MAIGRHGKNLCEIFFYPMMEKKLELTMMWQILARISNIRGTFMVRVPFFGHKI